MEKQFTEKEIRVLGCLIEKQITTPDNYPLTLNSLTLACNQKSNRDPVLSLSEEEVKEVLDLLRDKNLIFTVFLSNSRTERFKHRFDEAYSFDIEEKVILCELFIRGPQTAGELNTHTTRMNNFQSFENVLKALNTLMTHPDGPYIMRLKRQKGQKECRYAHLFCGTPEEVETEYEEEVRQTQSESPRLDILEEKVNVLADEIEELKKVVENIIKKIGS